MTVTFRDTVDESSELNGAILRDDNALLSVLRMLEHRQPPSVSELVAETGVRLLLGLGPKFSTAQYSDEDADVPYYVTKATGVRPDGESIDFVLGNEASEIPTKHCLPTPDVEAIAAYFCSTGQRHPGYEWEII